MEKNTLGTFLWVIVTVIVMLALVAFASPFGIYVRDNIDTFTGNYIDENKEEIPTDVAYHTITVKYNIPSDVSINIPDAQQTIKDGESYKIISPNITGYTPDKSIVEGIATEDTEITVTYTYAKYKIEFITNNGEWESSFAPPSSYIYKSSVSLPNAGSITRPHYTFVGWYSDENLTKEAHNITPSDYGDKTFYAKWMSTSYTITYNLNDSSDGGYYYHPDTKLAEWAKETDLSKVQSFKYGEQVDLPKTVNKFGYTFEGWSLEKDGKDKTKWRTQITETDSGNIVLYAQYSRNTYNIYYDLKFLTANNTEREYQIISNEYTIEDIIAGKTRTEYGYPKTYTYGEVITLPTVKLAGYDQYTSYEIWFDKDTEKIVVNSAGKLPNDSLITGYPSGMTQKLSISDKYSTEGIFDSSDIYVHIKPIPNNYYIKFDKNPPKTKRNNINTDMPNQIFTYDLKTKLNKNTYAFTGYTFSGWNTKADGTGDYYSDEAEIFNLTTESNKTITLYAQWTANDVNVTYKYYFQNIENDNYTLDTSKNLTTKYKADSSASLSPYIKQFSGFTAASTKYYDPQVGETDISTHSNDNGLSANGFYVLPDGTTEIHFYFTRNIYKLTFRVTPGNMFKTATAQGSRMKTINFTTNTNSTDRTDTKDVRYGETINFTATYELQHTVDYWTASTSPSTKSTNKTYSYVVPHIDGDGKVTVTLKNKWNQGTVTFKANYSGSPNPSWTADKTITYTYNTTYQNPGLPSITRDCYVFNGWYTAASGGTKINETDTFTTSSKTTLYARWKQYDNSYTDKHNFQEVSRQNATCVNGGWIRYKCSRCGITKQTTIGAEGHDGGKTIDGPASTCTTQGYYTVNCTKCGYELSRTNKPLIEHNFYGQCNIVHNQNHSKTVNIKGHTCIRKDNTKVNICYRHVVCTMCGTKKGELWCLTHGVGTQYSHGVTNCYRCGNKSHNCKENGSKATATKPCS